MRAGAGPWEYWPRVLSDWEYLTLMMLVLSSLVAGEALCSQYVGGGECWGNIAAGPECCDSELRARVSINTSLRGTSDMVTCDNNHTAIHEPS